MSIDNIVKFIICYITHFLCVEKGAISQWLTIEPNCSGKGRESSTCAVSVIISSLIPLNINYSNKLISEKGEMQPTPISQCIQNWTRPTYSLPTGTKPSISRALCSTPVASRTCDTTERVMQEADHFLASLRTQRAMNTDPRLDRGASTYSESMTKNAPEDSGALLSAGIKRDISTLSRTHISALEQLHVNGSSRDPRLRTHDPLRSSEASFAPRQSDTATPPRFSMHTEGNAMQNEEQDVPAAKKPRLEVEEENMSSTSHEGSEEFYDASESMNQPSSMEASENFTDNDPKQINQLLSWIGNLFSGNKV